MRIIALIPSRLKSRRIAQKPLLDFKGLPMIVHVYRRASLSSCVDEVWVATDSEKIKDVVEEHGGKAILTSDKHANGTERLAEAAEHFDCDYVVLVNGDEILLNPNHIQTSVNALMDSDAHASILVNKFYKTNSPSDFKVVLNLKNEVMYISRGDVPCDARNHVEFRYKAYHIMTFEKSFLSIYANLAKSPLEKIEDHEHLRVLENGYKIVAEVVDSSAISVDTQADISYVNSLLADDPFFKTYG